MSIAVEHERFILTASIEREHILRSTERRCKDKFAVVVAIPSGGCS
jgi:hypothetical protein